MNFKGFLKKERIIEQLKIKYLHDNDYEKCEKILDEIINKFFNLNLDKNNFKFIDLFGTLYQDIISREIRKNLGEFYTPHGIVNYILSNVGYNPLNDISRKKVIDLSCGSGSFLIQVVNHLVTHMLYKKNVNSINNLSLRNALKIMEIVQENIYGIDINPLACIFCNLNLIYSTYKIIKKIHNSGQKFDYLGFKIFREDTLKTEFREKFDFIIGNPPYLFIRDIPLKQRNLIESLKLNTNTGQYDYYQIFLEFGIELLNENGMLGYIVPDSILVLSNRKRIRKYIIENANIKKICLVNEAFKKSSVSNVILILQKVLNENARISNVIQIELLENNPLKINKLTQESIKKMDYEFLVHLTEKDIEIVYFLKSKFPKLEDIMNDIQFDIILSRGIELGKEGNIIYCNNCKKYIPLPRKGLKCIYCQKELNKENRENILLNKISNKDKMGNDIAPFLVSMKRYKINEYKYIKLNYPGINYKNLWIYKDRIIIRQLNQRNMICATHDEFSLTSQSYYNLKIVKSPIKEFNNYFLLGIINSRLISYFCFKAFSSYKKLFPRLLIERIKKIPIMIPKTPYEKEIALDIIKKVKYILNLYKNERFGKNLVNAKNLEMELDKLVFKLYNIDENFQKFILSSF
ncbi:MAG: N-6 DNA methylase [Promethearchaeia archaeon]